MFIVDLRCDTTIIVLSLFSLNDFKIIPSFIASTLLVGSSSKISLDFLKNALARPILCFWPLETLSPLLTIT